MMNALNYLHGDEKGVDQMASSRIVIDYTSTNYRRDDLTHQKFIEQEIADFNEKYSNLASYDRRTTETMALLLLVSSQGWISWLLLSAVYLLYAHEANRRPEYVKDYQDQLTKLHELFQWCVASAGNTISKDKTFLKLTEALLPVISYEELKKPFNEWNGIDVALSHLIVQCPLHRGKYIQERKSEGQGWVEKVFGKKQDDAVKQALANREYDDSLTHRVNRSFAETRFSLYGRQSQQQQTLVERAKQVVEPILAFKRLGSNTQ